MKDFVLIFFFRWVKIFLIATWILNTDLLIFVVLITKVLNIIVQAWACPTVLCQWFNNSIKAKRILYIGFIYYKPL